MTNELYESLKALALKHPIKVVTAKQPPRPLGYQAPTLPPSNVVFIDYVTLLKPERS